MASQKTQESVKSTKQRDWKSNPRSNKDRNNRNRHAKSDRKSRNYQDEFAKSEFKKGERAAMEKFPIKPTQYKGNDPQWYFKDAQTLKDYASFTYARPLGAPLPQSVGGTAKLSSFWTIPGLMVMKYLPTVGLAQDSQSPINLAAQNVYTRVRYKNSGKANYDVPDLMLYYIAATNLYAAWNWMKRIYGYAAEYSQNNWYKARAYAFAESVDLEDIVSNLSDFRGFLNMAAARISVFAVPAIFNYTVRQSWLVSNIYKDSNTSKAQEYMFTPVAFYRYDETSSPQGGILVPMDVALKENSSPRHNYSSLRTMLNTMINAMQYSEDVGNMSGDTLKEFEGNLCYLSTIDPDYRVEATFNSEVLMQIENAHFVSNWVNRLSDQEYKDAFTIRQNPNTNHITTKYAFLSHGSVPAKETVEINFHMDSPTPEDVIVATRFNAHWKVTQTSSGALTTIDECGSEILLAIDVIIYATGSPGTIYTSAKDLKLTRMPISPIILEQRTTVRENREDAALYAAMFTCWNAFDWAPAIYLYNTLDNGSVLQWPVLRDWDIYTSLDQDDLNSLNLLAVQSLFDVPYSS